MKKSILFIAICIAFSVKAQEIITFAGNGTTIYNGGGHQATATCISSPNSIATDDSGNIYISDEGNHVIWKVNKSGIASVVAGNESKGSGYSGDGGPATAATFDPNGLSVDKAGNIYVADASNNRVRKINTAGIITTIAGNGGAGYGADGIAATSTDINDPTDAAVDDSGNVYIADLANARVRKVNTNGIISTFAGDGLTYTPNGDGGPATAAQFFSARDITFDDSGNVT